MSKIIAVIPCRLKSSRLPNKGISLIYGITAIERCLLNAIAIRSVDKVFLATSTSPGDDPVVNCNLNGKIEVVRGPEEDVLERFLMVIKKENPDYVIRITGDCPSISTEIAEILIENHLISGADLTYTTSAVPIGTTCEVYSTSALLKVRELFPATNHSEYLIFYLITNPDIFNINVITVPDKFIRPWRLTLDEENDLILFNKLYEFLNAGERAIGFEEIENFFTIHPEAASINENTQVKYKDHTALVNYLKEVTKYKNEVL